MYRVLIRVDYIWFCIVQYCKGMPITSSALGAMPPSSIQTFVNYSYCIDHLLKEINVTLNFELWTKFLTLYEAIGEEIMVNEFIKKKKKSMNFHFIP